MLEKGWPWDSTEGDTREYGAQEIADAFTSFIKNGVLDAEGDFLLTPQSGNTLRISSGTAWINGRMLKLDGFEDIAIPYVSASETPRYGVLGLLLRPDVDHRDFTFFSSRFSDIPHSPLSKAFLLLCSFFLLHFPSSMRRCLLIFYSSNFFRSGLFFVQVSIPMPCLPLDQQKERISFSPAVNRNFQDILASLDPECFLHIR